MLIKFGHNIYVYILACSILRIGPKQDIQTRVDRFHNNESNQMYSNFHKLYA